MSEIILLFHKDDLKNPVCVERDDFYGNRWTTYKEYYVHVIDMFIFNRYGEVLLQKRSRRKKNSPGLYHTSVGGHINEGDSAQLTLIKECLEEVGAPCVLIEDQTAFTSAYQQLKDYTNSFILAYGQGMMEHEVHLEADHSGNAVNIQDVIYLCFGLYNGPLYNRDRDADGFERISLDELKLTLCAHPATFTPSYHVLYERLEQDMRTFVATYCELS